MQRFKMKRLKVTAVIGYLKWACALAAAAGCVVSIVLGSLRSISNGTKSEAVRLQRLYSLASEYPLTVTTDERFVLVRRALERQFTLTVIDCETSQSHVIMKTSDFPLAPSSTKSGVSFLIGQSKNWRPVNFDCVSEITYYPTVPTTDTAMNPLAWNQSGERAIYVCDRETSRSVFVVQFDGKSALKILADVANTTRVTWGPDDRSIWFTSGTTLLSREISTLAQVVRGTLPVPNCAGLTCFDGDVVASLRSPSGEFFRLCSLLNSTRCIEAQGDLVGNLVHCSGRLVAGELLFAGVTECGFGSMDLGRLSYITEWQGLTNIVGLSDDKESLLVRAAPPHRPPSIYAIRFSQQPYTKEVVYESRAPEFDGSIGTRIKIEVPGSIDSHGVFWQSKPVTDWGIIMVHGPQLHTNPSWMPRFQIATVSGWNLLALDQPGSSSYGRSYETHKTGNAPLKAVWAASRYLTQVHGIPAHNICLLGSSGGADLACSALLGRPDLFGMMCFIDAKLTAHTDVPEEISEIPLCAFYGGNAPGLSEAKRSIEAVFGRNVFDGRRGIWKECSGEGKIFRYASTYGEIQAILNAMRKEMRRDNDKQ
jgi:hypothetical protein